MKFTVPRFSFWRWFGLLVLVLTTSKNALAVEDNQDSQLCQSNLATAIEEIINRPELARSRWGIEIQTLAGKSLYSLNSNKFFTPASSVKLLVSAAALLELGAEYRIKTPIYSVGNLPTLTSLRLKGQGDPTITTLSLKNIVHQLQAKGIERIENLIIDDSYFDSPAINPTWEWLDVHSYFATAVNSTILNQNTVTLTLFPQQIGQSVKYSWSDAIAANQWQVVNEAVTDEADIEYDIELDGDLGKPLLQLRGELAIDEPPDVWDLAVVDPALYFLESLRSHLERAGIAIDRGTVIDRPYREELELETELAAIYSLPMQQILAEINQSSNNLYAEVLGKILAKELNVETATEAINLSLKEIGIYPDRYVLVDASGLSRQNLITPQTLVKILSSMSQTARGESYRQSLATVGEGTLKRRFIDPSVKRIWAKTGTLTGVSALAGYLFNEEDTAIVFSILVNNSELKSKEIRQAIDEIVIDLNHIKKC